MQGTSDFVLQTNNPLTDAGISGTGFLDTWGQVFTSNPDTLTLTAPNSDQWIYPGQSAVLTITFAPYATLVDELKISKGHGGGEITAQLVPEPSSIVLATFGTLGSLGYSLRRRIAK